MTLGMRGAGSALNPRRLINVEQFEQGDATKDVIVGVRTAMKMRHGAELQAIRSAHEQDSIQLQKKLRKAQGELAELKRRQTEQLGALQERMREAANKKQSGQSPGDPMKGGEPSLRLHIPGSDRGLCSPQNDDEADDEEEKAILQAAGKQVDIATKEQKWGWNFVEQLSCNSFPSKQTRWNGCTSKARRMWNGERYMDTHLLGAMHKHFRPGTQQSHATQLPDAPRPSNLANTWHPGHDTAPSPTGPLGQTAPAGGLKPALDVTPTVEINSQSASCKPQSGGALASDHNSSSATSKATSKAPSPINDPPPPESPGLPKLPSACAQSTPEPAGVLQANRISPVDPACPPSTSGRASPADPAKSTVQTILPTPDAQGSEVPAGTNQPPSHDARLVGLPLQRAAYEDLSRVGSPPRSRRARQRPKGQLADIQSIRKNVAALDGQFALPSAFEAYASKRMMKALE
jgi:hypothetical protein